MEPLHFSDLKYIAQSPAHYRERAKARKETPSLRKGSAVHAMVFETQRVLLYPEIRRGKAWEAFRTEHSDAIILSESEGEAAFGMAQSIMQSAPAQALIKKCTSFEQQLTWDIAGRPCAGTPDAWGPEVLLELKTGRTSRPGKFEWEVRKYAYHAQLDWYANALGHTGPVKVIAVENTAPYAVTVYDVTPGTLLAGRKLWQSWLNTLRVCEESNHWPAYSETEVTLDLDDAGEELEF